jgi:LacI family transcriptional regulator
MAYVPWSLPRLSDGRARELAPLARISAAVPGWTGVIVPANVHIIISRQPNKAGRAQESSMPRQSRVTIREIARMTGVSTQTVSRVINDRPDVSPATRAAVAAAIAEVGFQPSAVARSLVQRRSRMLGVLAAGLRYFGVAQTLNGIAEEAEAAGYSIMLKELASFEVPDIVPVVEFFVAHRVEGIIFASPQMEANVRHVQEQLPPSCPPIMFLKADPSPSFTTIGIDNRRAARLATDHLLSLGRRRIGHVAGPLDWKEARDRRDGWLEALGRANVQPGPVTSGDWSSASGVHAFEAMLEADPRLDAVFAANDQMALGVLHVAHDRGISVPGDLAVVGFDGLAEAAEFSPSLTTVRQPLGELGAMAVDELIAIIEERPGHEVGRAVVLPTELVVAESAPSPDRADRATLAPSDAHTGLRDSPQSRGR